MYAMPTFRDGGMANEMLREKMLQVDRICCFVCELVCWFKSDTSASGGGGGTKILWPRWAGEGFSFERTQS